jgi:CheY-like chemotaxis protein
MKKRVLIIDDDKQLNKINERVLHASGLVSELHIVGNGMEAIEYLNSRIDNAYSLPEIIVLELNLPKMNGFEFIQYFNEIKFNGKSRIELVVFTASSSPRDRQKAIQLGIRHYLNKPYLLRGLSDIISRLSMGTQDLFPANSQSW